MLWNTLGVFKLFVSFLPNEQVVGNEGDYSQDGSC